MSSGEFEMGAKAMSRSGSEVRVRREIDDLIGQQVVAVGCGCEIAAPA